MPMTMLTHRKIVISSIIQQHANQQQQQQQQQNAQPATIQESSSVQTVPLMAGSANIAAPTPRNRRPGRRSRAKLQEQKKNPNIK